MNVDVFSDDRGAFVPFFDLEKNGEITKAMGSVKRVYYVHNPTRGTIRGFHYHKKEWKFFVIVSGSAKFVALNPDDPKELYTFVSSERKSNAIVVPPGYANGWASLEDNTILVCASNATTSESRADDKRFDPMKWGDVWKVSPR